ncbi:abortive infection system antitoxin AbiGi family protein [Aliikangiella coralliicola]|uniref:Uncharacterized protein n=1 Tax=Aliikangiella coralliicola TaxID=2592383 RepID=A0A545UE75_9GAMM|nr:abortive infection system antitoxin AbiGi family protein [Aliikangiella coralliicola]TQV87776.1 hypothetical protein FLL46_10340 [Aliikangiella coralliicola]
MLLHFTKYLTTLESILHSSSFRLGYCTEYFGKKEQIISSAAHPMVCFSEYSEPELKSSNITYGGFAVALSKDWARNKGLSPVLYVEKNSQAATGIAALLKARQKHGKDAIPKNLRLPIMQVKCFTKHETGYNSYLEEDNYCFKSENEWRYVPTKKQIGQNYISLNKSTFLKNKEKYNNRLTSFPLKFEHSDVVAIYVQNEEQKTKITNQYSHFSSQIKLATWK